MARDNNNRRVADSFLKNNSPDTNTDRHQGSIFLKGSFLFKGVFTFNPVHPSFKGTRRIKPVADKYFEIAPDAVKVDDRFLISLSCASYQCGSSIESRGIISDSYLRVHIKCQVIVPGDEFPFSFNPGDQLIEFNAQSRGQTQV